jgi:predicted RNA-binding protein with PIN domain
MSSFRGAWITVLGDAVAAGRSVLRELDGREVPASLRRVAAYTGGNLPPPLATSLLNEIENNEWFRDKVCDEWSGEPGSVADLFLNRPGGWWMEVAGAVAKSTTGEGEAQVGELEKRLARLEEKMQKATDRISEQRKEIDTERRRAKEMVESAREAIEAKYAREVASAAEVRAEAESLIERLEGLESEHRDLQEAFATLRSRYAKARRLRPEESGAGGGSMPSDPVKLARLLDLQTASFGRTARDVPTGDVVAPDSPLSLDAGIRPDSADAMRWLIGLTDPAVVLVDGYNAQFHIDRSDFTSGAARRKLVEALRRLREASTARHRVVVVFDSTLPGERLPRSSLGGIEIRFTEQDAIADEEIVAMAENLDRVVVVSSDREVREGAEGNGAVVLWSEALAEWLGRL